MRTRTLIRATSAISLATSRMRLPTGPSMLRISSSTASWLISTSLKVVDLRLDVLSPDLAVHGTGEVKVIVGAHRIHLHPSRQLRRKLGLSVWIEAAQDHGLAHHLFCNAACGDALAYVLFEQFDLL